jgi:hypothetical protein
MHCTPLYSFWQLLHPDAAKVPSILQIESDGHEIDMTGDPHRSDFETGACATSSAVMQTVPAVPVPTLKR